MSTCIPARYRARARRDAAAFYLVELGRAVLAGHIEVGDGDAATTLPATGFVDLKIVVTQGGGTHRVDVTLRWPANAKAGALE